MTGKHSSEQDPRAALYNEVRQIMREEFDHYLRDIEFRLAQTYEVANRVGGTSRGRVFAEDLHILKHQLTGYTITANSPSSGSVAWASVHVVYNGTDYAMTDGNTALKYIWFDPDATNGTTTLQTSDTKPDLTAKPKAAMLFVNNGGTPVDVLSSSVPTVLGDGSVDSGAIQNGAVGSSALGSGAVTAGKIGSGAIDDSSLFGTGVVDAAAVGAAAITAAKLDTLQHILY